jgi:3'-5' exonuclease
MAFQVASPLTSIKSSKLSPKGSPSERLWIIAEAPLSKDQDKGFIFSSPMGWSYDKLLSESGLRDYYIDYFDTNDEQALLSKLNNYRPPFIVSLDTAGKHLYPAIKRKEDINLWAGSLLTSDKLAYPHYIIPTFGPETCISDWTERQVVKFIDYGKIRDELNYYNTYNSLQPLKSRQLITDLNLEQILFHLWKWKTDVNLKLLPISVDIETVYPKEKSDYYGHPGYPVCVGIAISDTYGISFPLFDWSTSDCIRLWKTLADLLENRAIIGQNFHSFDSWHFDMLGIKINRFKILDTMHRHAVLWPELSHKLQFLTRQYTRQPYYKQEGHGWSLKDLTRLKRYNALDCCVTYEVYNAQEEEFKKRPQLR